MSYFSKKSRNYIIYITCVIVLILIVFNTFLTFKVHNELEKMASKPGRWPVGAYIFDPNIGFDFAPNITGSIVDSSFSVISHNLGYRIGENDDSYDYSPGGVLSLGCSLTYGDEVESEETFTQIIADSLSLAAYNYGVSSFSYIHALVKAEKLKSSGILDSLKPSIVILGCWKGLTKRSRTPFPPLAQKNVPLTSAYIVVDDEGARIEYPTSTNEIFELAKIYREQPEGFGLSKFTKLFFAIPKFAYIYLKNIGIYRNARGFSTKNKVSDYEIYDFYFTGIESIFSDNTKIIVLFMPIKGNDQPNEDLLKAVADHPNILFVDGLKAVQKYQVPTYEYQGKHPHPQAHHAYATETLNILKE